MRRMLAIAVAMTGLILASSPDTAQAGVAHARATAVRGPAHAAGRASGTYVGPNVAAHGAARMTPSGLKYHYRWHTR